MLLPAKYRANGLVDSVQSEIHASKTKYSEGKLTHSHPIAYKLFRFLAFLQSDVGRATKSKHQANSLLPSTSSTSAAPIDPHIFPITLTNTSALLAHSLTKEAVMKLRVAQAWIYDETKKHHKVTINLALVRLTFFQKSTVHNPIYTSTVKQDGSSQGPRDWPTFTWQ